MNYRFTWHGKQPGRQPAADGLRFFTFNPKPRSYFSGLFLPGGGEFSIGRFFGQGVFHSSSRSLRDRAHSEQSAGDGPRPLLAFFVV